jgi:hypothetical protein
VETNTRHSRCLDYELFFHHVSDLTVVIAWRTSWRVADTVAVICCDPCHEAEVGPHAVCGWSFLENWLVHDLKQITLLQGTAGVFVKRQHTFIPHLTHDQHAIPSPRHVTDG